MSRLQHFNLTNDATILAVELNRKSEFGYGLIGTLSSEEIGQIHGWDSQRILDAIADLENAGLIRVSRNIGGSCAIYPENPLFWCTDDLAHNWDTERDANLLLSRLTDQESDSVELSKLAEVLKWEPRRINPAATLLREGGFIGASQIIGRNPFVFAAITPTPEARNYLRKIGLLS